MLLWPRRVRSSGYLLCELAEQTTTAARNRQNGRLLSNLAFLIVVPVAQIAASGLHLATSDSSSSRSVATGFVSLSCFVSGFRVGAITCVIAGCARAWANAFPPTSPVAPRIRTFMPNTPLSCEPSQVIPGPNLAVDQHHGFHFWRSPSSNKFRPARGPPACWINPPSRRFPRSMTE